ncbi:MAG: hydrogen peroxide-dependent heme synthase [Verrucomicrobiota bacterium]
MSNSPSSLSADQFVDDDLRPAEGWHVAHLFYHIDQAQWDLLSEDEQIAAKTNLTKLIQEIRATPETQLLSFSMVTPKADIGFMLLTPDLHDLNHFEKRLTASLGPDILSPAYSYLSMTERSEYTTTSEQYAAQIMEEKGLSEDSEDFKAAMTEFDERMKKYSQDRLYPNMPDWPVFCFYSMAKRRGEGHNWYGLDFETRRLLMKGHAAVGRQWAGKIRQLITGSVGLDESEWGVTLFARDTFDVKGIVYQMRFDEVTVKYGEFGDFYIGIQLPLDQLFRRLGI